MNLLFEIADRDLLFIFLAVVGLIILGIVIFYIVTKNNKIKPIAEDERFDNEKPLEEPKELTEEQKQAKAELERVFNMMSADLEASNEEPSVIDEFEKEQEENAIISYQELIKQAKAKGQIKDDISKEEVYQTHEPKHERIEETKKPVYYEEKIAHKNVVPEPKVEEPKKFKNSEFISPIFGVQGSNNSYPSVKKVERRRQDVQRRTETDENEQFLKSLKEFRENL